MEVRVVVSDSESESEEAVTVSVTTAALLLSEAVTEAILEMSESV